MVVGAKIEGGAGKLKRNTSLTRSSDAANPVSSVNALGEQAEETIPFLGFIVCDQCFVFVIKEKSSCLLPFRIGAMPGFGIIVIEPSLIMGVPIKSRKKR